VALTAPTGAGSVIHDAAQLGAVSATVVRAEGARGQRLSTVGITSIGDTHRIYKQTGIKVQYDTSIPTIRWKQAARRQIRLRLVVPTAILERQIKAGVSRSSTRAACNLARLAGHCPRLAGYDPGTSTPSTTCGHNRHLVQRQGDARATRSNGKIAVGRRVKPENLAKFKDCGVHMLDSSDDIMPALALPRPQSDSADPKELDKAADLDDEDPLPRCGNPFLEYLQRAGERRDLLRGRLVGDIKAGAEARREARTRRIAIRSEGGGPDVLRQPRHPEDAKNVARRTPSIDFLLKPEVAAKNSNLVAYANATWRARTDRQSVLEDPSIYPDAGPPWPALHGQRRATRIARALNGFGRRSRGK